MAAVAGSIERRSDLQTATSSTASTCVITFPRTPKVGEMLVIGACANQGGSGTINTPSGWIQVNTAAFASNARTLVVLLRCADGTEGSSVTLTHTASPTQWLAILTAYSGVRQLSGNNVLADSLAGGHYVGATTTAVSSTTCTLNVNYADATRSPRVGLAFVASSATWGTPTINANAATSANVIQSIDISTTMSLGFVECAYAPAATSGTPPSVVFGTSRSNCAAGLLIPSENARTMMLGVG
jgi:hypothetical protein